MKRACEGNRRPTGKAVTHLVAISVGALAFGVVVQAQPAGQAVATNNDAFYWLNEQNKASLIMLAEEGIITEELGTNIASSLTHVIADGAKPGAARSRDYLVVEADMIDIGGPDVSRLHSGRSRQDLGQTSTRLNLSALGGAAGGTSSFPVNRARLAELLGFDGLVVNSFDAGQIANQDNGVELTTAAASGALTVSMLAADLTAQYADPHPWFRLQEGAQAGVSSIMPQKRNPMASSGCTSPPAR